MSKTSPPNAPKTTVPVPRWLVIAFLGVIIIVAVSRITALVVDQYAPVEMSGPPATMAPTPQPSIPPLVLVPSQARAVQTAAPQLEDAQLSTDLKIAQRALGSGVRVFVYRPEFGIGSAAEDEHGTLYVSFMWALRGVCGPGCERPDQLGVLTAGAVRPLVTPFVGPSTVSMDILSTGANPPVFRPNEGTYVYGPSGVAGAPWFVEASGSERLLNVRTAHFGNLVIVGEVSTRDRSENRYWVTRGSTRAFLWEGHLFEAGPHRLLLGKELGDSTYLRYLEAFAF